MKTYFIIALAIMLASLSVLALTDDNSEKTESQSYIFYAPQKFASVIIPLLSIYVNDFHPTYMASPCHYLNSNVLYLI